MNHRGFFSPFKRVAIFLLCLPICAASVQAQPKTVAKKSATTGATAKFALLVGVNKHADKEMQEIRGAVNDVQDMRQMLVDLYGFETNKINLLTDEHATRQGIIEGFQKIVENARQNPSAIIFLHFSGNGTQTPDKNGDEPDGLDEVMTPFDYQRKTGENGIIDDEIDRFLNELVKYSRNVTFIYDACHGFEQPDMPGNQTGVARTAPEIKKTSSNRDVGDLERSLPQSGNNGFVIINAALTNQYASEKTFEENGTKKVNSVLTLFLIKELRKTPVASYRDLIQRVAQQIQTDYSRQTPQAIGDVDRLFLGGIGQTFEVKKVEGSRITLNAGTKQGLSKDVRLALYKPQTKNLNGYEDRLAEAVIVEATETSSIAEVVGKTDVPVGAKAIFTVVIKQAKLRVAFDEKSLRDIPNKAEIVGALTEQLNNSGIETIGEGSLEAAKQQAAKLASAESGEKQSLSAEEAAKSSFDVIVAAGKFGEVFAKAQEQLKAVSKRLPLDDQTVFYLAGRDGLPKFGFFVETTNAEAAPQIAQAARQAAAIYAFKQLYKEGSPLNSALEVSLVQVEGETKPITRLFKITAETPVKPVEGSENIFRLDYGAKFRLKIHNKTKKDIYLTALNFGTNGSVDVFKQAATKDEILRGGEDYFSPVFCANGLAGEDIFKFIASEKPYDFSFASAATRGTELLYVPLWGTKQVNLLVAEPAAAANVPQNRKIETIEKNLHILAIGIDKHQDKNRQLKFSVSDAKAMIAALEMRGGEVYNVRTHLLLEEQAKRAGIENAFKEIIAEAKPDDVFVFYNPTYDYTSAEKEDGTAEWFILPQDVVPSNDEKSDWRKNAISPDLLRSWVSSIKAQNQILIFDSSPQALERFVLKLGEEPKSARAMLKKNFVVFGGNGMELADVNHAEFTNFLLQGLDAGKAYSGLTRNQITVRDMQQFLRGKQSRQRSSRLFQSFSIGDDFSLGAAPKTAIDAVEAKSTELMKGGGKDDTVLPSDFKPIKSKGENFALLIATDDYDHKFDYNTNKGFKKLNNPVRDADEIASVLRDHYDFKVEVLRNESKSRIIDKIEKEYFIRRPDKKPWGEHDQLFIFLSGHGDYDEDWKDGGVAVKESKSDEIGSYLNWSWIKTRLDAIKTRHILLAIDVCKSGSFFKFEPSKDPEGRTVDPAIYYEENSKYLTRKAIASSAKDRLSSDGLLGGHSPFANALLNALKKPDKKLIRFLDLESAITQAEKYGGGTQNGVGGTFGKGEAEGDFFFIPKTPQS